MKPSLQLSLGHQLNLTPQLQQAIRLLQLSTLDLHQEIQQAIENNPLLEIEKTDSANDSTLINEANRAIEEKNETTPDVQSEFSWDEIYPSSNARSISEEFNSFDNLHGTEVSLHDHLIWQLDLTPMSDTDHEIALTIIDGVDDNGFLSVTLDDVLVAINRHRSEDPIDLSEVKAVLHLVQRFDPIGVAAENLMDCLLIQLSQFPSNTPLLFETKQIVENHLDWLAQRNYNQLMSHYKISQEQLQNILKLIQSLDPRPGEKIAKISADYIIPDVIVKLEEGTWKVELNPEVVPKLRVNQLYANLIQRGQESKDNRYLKNHLQEARWFIKSLQSRHETLLKVTTSIIKKQLEFLEHGEEAMKPLILNDIAHELNMHESTISRVTTQKYIHTPRGVFELKYFFSSHVGTKSGGECSSTAIQAVIKKIISAENPKKPLSDNKIAHILQDQGINIARRTVAKYREALNIPASNLRKCL